jgi:CDP-diacylglycerol--glycerol-3-phosphate 3-phosphatidyltransferase
MAPLLSSARLLPAHLSASTLRPVTRALAAAGVTPNMLSFVGVLGNCAAGTLIACDRLRLAGAVTAIASALDTLDGGLARETNRVTRFGALLDSTFDRVSEVSVLLGVLAYALRRRQNDLAVLAFTAAGGSLLVSYIRARAEGLQVSLTEGIFTRPERVLVLSAGLLFGWLRPAMWLLAVITPLTAAQRLLLAKKTLEAPSADSQPTP